MHRVWWSKGCGAANVCAIILHHNIQLYPLYLAVCAAGAIPAILAYPNPRLHPDKFRQGIEGMSRRSGLDWILTERELQPVLEPLVTGSGSTIKGLHFPLEWQGHREDSRLLQEHPAQLIPTDPLLLQHSSGTTGLQKPVLLAIREPSKRQNPINRRQRASRALASEPLRLRSLKPIDNPALSSPFPLGLTGAPDLLERGSRRDLPCILP